MKYTNAKDALNWLVNHPLEKLYDQYGNFYLWGPYSNVIEYHYEIDIENWIWDMDRINADEFLEYDLSGDNYLETI
jgi:hypothetical protein